MVNDNDKLQAANREALNQVKGGAKQIEDAANFKKQLEEVKERRFGNSKLAPEVEQEMKDRDRFGDPLKLMGSTTVHYGKSQTQYRILTPQNGKKYILSRCNFPGTQNRFDI